MAYRDCGCQYSLHYKQRNEHRYPLMDQSNLSTTEQGNLETKALPEKRYCTSCQTDRVLEGGIL